VVVVACVMLGASTSPVVRPALVVSPEPVVTATGTATTTATVAMVPLYPWGTDHNGSARMYADQVTTVGGITTITAVRDLTQTPPLSSHRDNGVYPPITYRAGALHSAQPVTIAARRMRIAVEAQLPSEKGTWPAIWLTGVDSWPPEIDLAEYLGSNQVLQNVFSTTKRNSTHVPTRVEHTENWHTYTADLTPYTNGDVLVEFSIDDRASGSVVADQLVGQKLWLIANLQMERWSGSPGPERAVMRFRNLIVT
jgi:beta-glucanase (GH16 family)